MIKESTSLLEKVSPSKKQIEDSVSLFGAKISKELELMEHAHEKKAQAITRLINPYQSQQEIRDVDAAASFAGLKEWAEYDHKQQRTKLTNGLFDLEPRREFMISIDDRLRVAGPPYDVEWSSGAIGYAHKNTGEFGISPMNGYAAAAVGTFISPAQDAIARITAYMPITFSWFNWILGSGYASTYGGVGVLVYDLSNGSVVADSRAQLWNAAKSDPGLSNQGETQTYLSYTSAAETYFAMRGGRQYLAWMWCWGGTYSSGNLALSMASIACKVPFIVVKPWLSI